MRLSIEPKDPGYKPMEELKRYRVFFDGVEKFNCHTADEEKGFIRTLSQARPAPWLPVVNRVSAPIKGKVEIRRK